MKTRPISTIAGLTLVVAAAVTTGTLFAQSQPPRGLVQADPEAGDGYTLIAPLRSGYTYLLNRQGEPVHRWKSDMPPGNAVYLLEDGDLLRACRARETAGFHGGGIGGHLQRYDWDGNLVWDYPMADENLCQHHDVEPLPNGNVLVIAWERVSRADAIAAGFAPDAIGDEIWLDQVLEVKPEGATGGRVVWRWRTLDHLVQQRSKDAANYGRVAESPGRINCDHNSRGNAPGPAELARLRGLGYVGGDEEEPDEAPPERGQDRGRGGGADWQHVNAISYNAELDQIALSVHRFNEVWIIDHAISTEQAAGPRGDLLYRWGNPQAYAAGRRSDQRLFSQHDVRWVRTDAGEWELSVYNNGANRPGGNYSSVERIRLPRDARGAYRITDGRFGPDEPTWRYAGTEKERFYSSHISGAEQLPGGNMLVCVGESGRVFEVTPDGRIVWDYRNPHGGDLREDRRGPDRRRGGPPSDRARRGPPPDGRGGPPPGGPGGRRGPGEGNALFRAQRYPADYPGLAGRTLRPIEVEK